MPSDRIRFSEPNRHKPISVCRKKVVNVVTQTASVCPPPVVSFATVSFNHEWTMKRHMAPSNSYRNFPSQRERETLLRLSSQLSQCRNRTRPRDSPMKDFLRYDSRIFSNCKGYSRIIPPKIFSPGNH